MPRVLVIDDDQTTSQVIGDVLERNGHTAVSPDKPWEAARLLSDGGIDVIVADVFIRSLISSVQIVLALRQVSSEIPVLFISGTPLEGWSDRDFAGLEALMPGRLEFLLKPFTAKALVNSVSELLEPNYDDVVMRSVMVLAKRWRDTTEILDKSIRDARGKRGSSAD